MFNINNIFKKMPESEKNLAGIKTEQFGESKESFVLKNLNGEELYISLLSKLTEDKGGAATREDTERSKEIVNFLLNSGFKTEVEACTKLHSKECGDQLLELYKLATKN